MAEETTDVFNSTFEVDTETSILDRKFEIDDTPNKRRSTRNLYIFYHCLFVTSTIT